MPGEPFVELRDVRVEHIELLLVPIVDGNYYVWPERLRTREVIAEMEEHRVLVQGRYIRHDVGDRDPSRLS